MKNIVIGLIGQKDSGKSTIARIIAEELKWEMTGVITKNIGFADPIYAAIAAFGFDVDKVKNDKAGRHVPQPIFGGKTIYEMMLYFGQKGPFGQAINTEIYVDSAKQRIDDFFGQHGGHNRIVFVDNIRHHNEAAMVKRYENHFIVGVETHLDNAGNHAEALIPELQRQYADLMFDNRGYPERLQMIVAAKIIPPLLDLLRKAS